MHIDPLDDRESAESWLWRNHPEEVEANRKVCEEANKQFIASLLKIVLWPINLVKSLSAKKIK
jgi:hypothetical protein